jgi:outer membrane receptor protein involved in Fe transport
MPVNMPTHAHGQGYTDLNFVIPELISRVTYNKGPYFAEDGDFGSAGSARIAYADKLPFSLASLTAGTFDYQRVLFAGSPKLGAGALTYGFEYQHNDGPWDNPNDFGSGTACCAMRRAPPRMALPSQAWLTRRTGTRPTRSRAAQSTRG